MKGIPKIVLERLRGRTIGNQDNRRAAIEDRPLQHPDANLLTALLERRLTERERTQILKHLAECADCREIAALTLPTEAETTEPVLMPVRSAWSVRPVLRWGALAAALGTVLIVAVLRQDRKGVVQNGPNNAPPAMVANAGKTNWQAPLPLTPQPTAKAAPRSAGARSRESASEMAELKKTTPPGAQPPSPAPPATLPKYTASADLSTGANTDLLRAAAKPGAFVGHPPVHTYDKRGLAGQAGASLSISENALQARLPMAVSRGQVTGAVAQRGPLWTISPEGKLQRSFDAGKSWENVGVDDKVEFRVVQSNGKEIWAGGTGGALYHSSDGGATWTRVNLASGTPPTTAAIVSIDCSSSDSQHITVKTASGERWISEDGGQQWRSATGDE